MTERDAWFAEKANQVLARLPANTTTLLSRFRVRTERRQIEHALLALFAGLLYRRGWSPDEIAAHWAACGAFVDADRRTLLDDLVVPVRSLFLTCQLPFRRYWNISPAAGDFLIYHCASCLRAELPRQTLIDDLQTLW